MPAPSQKAREYYEKTYGFIGGALNDLELKEAGEFDLFTLGLREALGRYGFHEAGCSVRPGDRGQCDCGLLDILDAYSPEEEKG